MVTSENGERGVAFPTEMFSQHAGMIDECDAQAGGCEAIGSSESCRSGAEHDD